MFKDIFLTREEGFTLTEVIIVLVIIGVLAAIAIPVFANNRNKGLDDKLKNDMQNIQMLLETKRLDNNGNFPDLSTDIVKIIEKRDDGIAWTYTPSSDFTDYCLKANRINDTDRVLYTTSKTTPTRTACNVS